MEILRLRSQCSILLKFPLKREFIIPDLEYLKKLSERKRRHEKEMV